MPMETIMDDFPLWLKSIVWLMVGSVVVYTAVQVILSALG
jgi:hypothetical protein